MNLSIAISKIPGIGSTCQKRLKKIGIKTVRDLLFHFPHRYEDFSNIIHISKIKINETSCVKGKILEIKNSRTWRKKMILTQAILEDGSGAIKVVWFNQPYLTKILKVGDNVCLAGKTYLGEEGIYLSNPAYEKIVNGKESSGLTHTGRLIPVYPETEGLSSRWLRYIIKPILLGAKDKISETLPQKIIQKNKLLPIKEAIWQVHFPDSLSLAKEAQKRFSFEELFNLSLWVLKERQRLNRERSIPVPIKVEVLQDFVKSLPFKLTDSQKKSSWQILKDMEKPRPMNRLLEGDVGSGKTIVAMMAALNAVKQNFQTVLMAPTEILAKQHFHTFSNFLKDFNINIGLLTGKEDKWISKKLKNQVVEISRKKLIEKAKNGELDILIGTHALISPSGKNKISKKEPVKFKNLALIIVDEQHRFGVEQRAKLCQTTSENQLKLIPHLLSMTATPIPRTLALTIYGDLDLSLIDELPKERKKIITKIIAPAEREKYYDFIRKQVKKGRQVFVICPRIEPENNQKSSEVSNEISSWSEVKTVKDEYQKLSKIIFPDLKIGMLHGKMKTKEKEKIMHDFKFKKTDILVSTSVIEVGIDVPNATVMIIEGAERFGLAQLHQFRGRVGRSKYQSYCFLFTDSPAKKTRLRLKALLESESGFKLAEKDLEIRGPGELSGQRQWGIPDLAMASLKDVSLVEKARGSAKEILEEDPGLKKYYFLQKELGRFEKRVHLE